MQISRSDHIMLGRFPRQQGLYDPRHEHDSCGVGFVANIDGTKTHAIVEKGIEVLKNLEHRGAIGGDRFTGDGAGILFQIPDGLFRRECHSLEFTLPEQGAYGVGMLFLPSSPRLRQTCFNTVEKAVQCEGLGFLGWREVPVDTEAIKGQAKEEQPFVAQCFIDGKGLEQKALERKLYVIRKQIERSALESFEEHGPLYVPSLSCRTIVYKGLFTATQLPGFYKDLKDPDVTSALALIHQRYSTNTFPHGNWHSHFVIWPTMERSTPCGAI